MKGRDSYGLVGVGGGRTGGLAWRKVLTSGGRLGVVALIGVGWSGMRIGVAAAVVFLLTVVLYVWAAGALAAIANRGVTSPRDADSAYMKTMQVVYFPLLKLAEESDGFREMLLDYVDWWEKVLGN